MNHSTFAGLSGLRLALLLLVGGPAAAHATPYAFGNFDTTLLQPSGHAWTETLGLQLGKFSVGFTPDASNTADWASHWLSPDAPGYYTTAGGIEWSASLTLVDNATFAAGDQLYLWVYDTQATAGGWGLFTDASWLVAANSGIDPSFYSYDFGANSFAVLGQLDRDALTATTAGGSAIPEPASVALIAGVIALGAVGQQCLGRRRAAPR